MSPFRTTGGGGGGKFVNCVHMLLCLSVPTTELPLLRCRMASRCFWDDETDQYAFESFKNVSLVMKGFEQCPLSA